MEWQVDINAGDDDIVVGQMDDDPSLEVATSNGLVFDVDSRQIQWDKGEPFGFELELADFDGDGREELMARYFEGEITAYNVELHQVQWLLRGRLPSSFDTGDVDADGRGELLVADHDGLRIYDLERLTLERTLSFDPGIGGDTEFCILDLDGIEGSELVCVWQQLQVIDFESGERLWQDEVNRSPVGQPALGSFRQAGSAELVFASGGDRGAGESASRLYVYDAVTRERIARTSSLPSWVLCTDFHDFDSDGDLEIVTGHWNAGQMVRVFDLVDGELVNTWTNATPTAGGAETFALEVADVDGDGVVEVLAGGGDRHAAVFLFDVGTREEIWRTPTLGGHNQDMRRIEVANVDDDSAPELLALPADGDVHVFDGVSRESEAVLPGPFTDFRVYRGPSGRVFVIAADDQGQGHLFGFAGSGFQSFGVQRFTSGPIDGFTIDSSGFIWVGSEGRVHAFRSPFEPPFWISSEKYWESYGRDIGVGFHDGRPWVMASGIYSVNLFELERRDD